MFMRPSLVALSLGPSKRISPEREHCTLYHPITLCVFLSLKRIPGAFKTLFRIFSPKIVPKNLW